jgi:hypothetical protein
MARYTRADNARAAQKGTRAVSRKVKTISGQPGMPLTQPAPAEGKRSIRRLIKRDPLVGLSMPEADRITDTHTDVGGPGGYRGAGVKVKRDPSTTAPMSGKKKVRAASLGRLVRR